MPFWAHAGIGIAVLLAAIWRGRWAERIVSGGVLGTAVIVHLVCAAWPCWRGPAPIAFPLAMSLDLPLAALFVIVALKSRRYWVLWAASLQLLELAIDLIGWTQPGWGNWPLAAASYIFSYLIYACALWGVWTSPPAQRRSAAG